MKLFREWQKGRRHILIFLKIQYIRYILKTMASFILDHGKNINTVGLYSFYAMAVMLTVDVFSALDLQL